MNNKPLWITLIALLTAGAIAGGIAAGVLLSRGNNGGNNEEEGGGGVDPEPLLHEHWYEYTEEEKWWEHCSSGGPEEAIEEDVGKIVHITLNGKKHEVRLIAVDHLEPGQDDFDEIPQAHCTFEFNNVITKNDGTPYTTVWAGTPGVEGSAYNYNFLDSTLNTALQEGGDVYQYFEDDAPNLLAKMKIVTKFVAYDPTETGSEENYTITSYDTKLFPLAFRELTYQQNNGYLEEEGRRFKYYVPIKYSDNDSRIKNLAESGTGAYYWTRSPQTRNPPLTCIIKDTGVIVSDYVYYNNPVIPGVAPAFCI